MKKGKLSKEKLLIKLRRICSDTNSAGAQHLEQGHRQADDLLLRYIDDEDITVAFKVINKWYC